MFVELTGYRSLIADNKISISLLQIAYVVPRETGSTVVIGEDLTSVCVQESYDRVLELIKEQTR